MLALFSLVSGWSVLSRLGMFRAVLQYIFHSTLELSPAKDFGAHSQQ